MGEACRIGVIAVISEKAVEHTVPMNRLISKHRDIIIGRVGIPKPEQNLSIISLIVEGSTDEIGALAGKLGSLSGTTVKTALTKPLPKEEE